MVYVSFNLRIDAKSTNPLSLIVIQFPHCNQISLFYLSIIVPETPILAVIAKIARGIA